MTDNIGRDYSGLARRFGYRLIAVQNPHPPSAAEIEKVWRHVIELGNPIRQLKLVVKYGFDPVMESMFAAARDLCAANDVVVGHFFVYPLRVAAEKTEAPVATLNIVHNCLPSRWICPPGLPNLGRWFNPLGWRLVRTVGNRIFLPRVNALRRREGLRPDTDLLTQTWAAETLNLIAVSPEICQAPPDWEPWHRVCGFLNHPPMSSAMTCRPGSTSFFPSEARPFISLLAA